MTIGEGLNALPVNAGAPSLAMDYLGATGAGPSTPLTLQNAYDYFTPPLDVARFALGPDFSRSAIEHKIAMNMAARDLSARPSLNRFEVADRARGIIEFREAQFNGRLPWSESVAELEKLLGVRRLPEGLRAVPVGGVFLCRIFDLDDGVHARLLNLFGALAASGAEPKLEIDPEYTPEKILEIRAFSSKLSASFVSDDQRVALKFSAEPLYFIEVQSFLAFTLEFISRGYARIPSLHHLTYNSAHDAKFPIEAVLLKEEDRNSVEGHDVLRRGFENLFGRFLEGADDHYFKMFVQGGLLRLGYIAVSDGDKPMPFEAGLANALQAFKISKNGWYYPKGLPVKKANPLPRGLHV